MKNYFHECETVLEYIKSNNYAYCQSSGETTSILMEFCAYCLLNDISFSMWSRSEYEKFIKVSFNDNEDLLDQILMMKNPIRKKGFLELFYRFDFVKDELKEMADISWQKNDSEENFSDIKIDSDTIENIFGIKLMKNTRIMIHVARTISKILQMYTFTDAGVLLIVGKDNMKQLSHSVSITSYSGLFKALADESRLKIVTLLMKKPSTLTEISHEVEITLSTANHHVKILMEEGVISMETLSTRGKGVRYRLNCSNLLELIKKAEQKMIFAKELYDEI